MLKTDIIFWTRIRRIFPLLPIFLVVIACYKKAPEIVEQEVETLSDDSLLNLVEYRTFQYFWDGAAPEVGSAPSQKY